MKRDSAKATAPLLDAEHWRRVLTRLRIAHAEGKPNAARDALMVCATCGIVMPPWLAELVNDAIVKSAQGIPDDIFGMGNADMLVRWRRAYVKNRNAGIRQGHEFLKSLGAKGVIPHLAKLHNLSAKSVEAITNRRKNPIRKPKK